jgi:hypothetical protein
LPPPQPRNLNRPAGHPFWDCWLKRCDSRAHSGNHQRVQVNFQRRISFGVAGIGHIRIT